MCLCGHLNAITSGCHLVLIFFFFIGASSGSDLCSVELCVSRFDCTRAESATDSQCATLGAGALSWEHPTGSLSGQYHHLRRTYIYLVCSPFLFIAIWMDNIINQSIDQIISWVVFHFVNFIWFRALAFSSPWPSPSTFFWPSGGVHHCVTAFVLRIWRRVKSTRTLAIPVTRKRVFLDACEMASSIFLSLPVHYHITCEKSAKSLHPRSLSPLLDNFGEFPGVTVPLLY